VKGFQKKKFQHMFLHGGQTIVVDHGVHTAFPFHLMGQYLDQAAHMNFFELFFIEILQEITPFLK
jgi:hypothetical protein